MFDLADLRESAAKAAIDDVRVLTTDELMAAALDLERTQRHLDAARARVLAELDATQATVIDWGMRTPGWVAREAPQHEGQLRTRVRIAGRLRGDLAEAGEALAAARIGWDHVRVLDRVANPRIVDAIGEILPELVTLAEHLSFGVWSREVSAIAEQLDQDGGYRPETDPARNRLRVASGLDGTVHLDGTFVGEAALEIQGLLDQQADRVWRRYRELRDLDENVLLPSRAQLLAEALVELLRIGSGTDLASTAPPRPDVTVVIHADGRAVLPDGTSLRHHLLEALLRRGQLHGVHLDHRGSATGPAVAIDGVDPDSDLGHAIALALGETCAHDGDRGPRFATRAHRRAVAARDGGCVVPGCNAPISWTDLHHVIRWEDGGATRLENLAPLCRFHHGITHRLGWTMHATEDQWFWWQTPAGQTFWSQRHGLQRAGPTPRPG